MIKLINDYLKKGDHQVSPLARKIRKFEKIKKRRRGESIDPPVLDREFDKESSDLG